VETARGGRRVHRGEEEASGLVGNECEGLLRLVRRLRGSR
jgi:hypothetical protein